MGEMMKKAYRRKAAGLQRKRDELSELPDGVLSRILSLLTLKEAIKTSILSKKWRYVWTNHPDLLLDSVNIFGGVINLEYLSDCEKEYIKQLSRKKFVELVDSLMHQRSNGLKIDSLSIHFHLGEAFASYIDKWIRFADGRGVETLNLDLSERRSFKGACVPEHQLKLYIFPSPILASPGRHCTLKTLQLASCCLGPPPIPCDFGSLLSVELRDVTVSDQHLELFLSMCLYLETLTLHCCNGLVSFKYYYPSSQLKFLRIQDCLRLETVEINSEHLSTFDYIGELVRFSFKNAPKLANVFLNFTGGTRVNGATYALSRIACEIPQLESLNILSVHAMKTLKLPKQRSSFSNIKLLILTVFPFHDEDELVWINYILEAFPLLRELQLNLFSPNYVRRCVDIERHLPVCSHKNIRKLEINGFSGYKHDSDLLTYLLKSLSCLQVLVINLQEKQYSGFNRWEYEAAAYRYKVQRENLGWLHEVVPPAVELKIQ